MDVSRLKPKERDEAKKEIKLLASFHHPNIVRYRDSFLEAGILNIVMDFAEGGDLHGLLKAQGTRSLPEEQVLDYYVQLCLAMKHVHDRKVLHRDIKSQNIFLTQNRKVLKLGDFGIARVLNSTQELARTACGTPYYMSPEICDNQPYNDRSDVWSMGCLLYEMATLRCPFDARDMRGLVIKILRGAYPPLPRSFSSELGSLVSTCLARKPAQRPSVNQLLAMPIVRRRIEKFLTEAEHATEFAHTMLHRNPSRNHQHPAAPTGAPGRAEPAPPSAEERLPRPSGHRPSSGAAARPRAAPSAVGNAVQRAAGDHRGAGAQRHALPAVRNSVSSNRRRSRRRSGRERR